MDKQIFIKEVQEELDTIKERATTKEINKLNISNFDHSNRDRCIYGLMTGKCNSRRAKEIYLKKYFMIAESGYSTSHIKFENQSFELIPRGFTNCTNYTALEKYLYMVDSNKHEEIINYLKGNINVIDLTLDSTNNN